MNRHITTFTLVVLLGLPFLAQAQANKACALASPAEVEAVLGAKVTGLNSPGTGGNAQFCAGSSSKGRWCCGLAHNLPHERTQGLREKGRKN